MNILIGNLKRTSLKLCAIPQQSTIRPQNSRRRRHRKLHKARTDP